MSDMVDRISDHDDDEEARIQRVRAGNNVVFESLFRALRNRISKFNERNLPDFGFPNAVSIGRGPFSQTQHSLKIQNNIAPRPALAVDFPINSGAMQIEFSTEAEKSGGSIELDIVNDTPTYYRKGKGHSADGLADLLLEPVLSTTKFWDAGRKIGFV